ncbi:GNAT family N-acetyltransferase [Streptococcus saliviloxodontae]|uniref:N-acetylglutamate synthase-like GNAT family acetyltransferase n=1 Tax=Streptococcus saliviloxodontae TaxID=1349416 RepID=A0ABS2PIK9_9STRE|nr:GNAT family N-acetyltransferase [Streptococcus saliviloxodontae]MBM7635257.1 N-acetylglutamate synthase-like GNAT family acetyltransferase [Streptococcus saliviloxodontae]
MVTVTVFEKEDNQAVSDLILSIQREEFGLAIDLDDQPDAASYQQKGGQFWTVKTKEGAVVACIGLVALKDGNVALKKMFVAKAYRRYGLGRLLVDRYLTYCREHAFQAVFLGTTDRFQAAQQFYQKVGFKLIEKGDLPVDFPLLEVDNRYYCYQLN